MMVNEDHENETKRRLQGLLDKAEALGEAGGYTDALEAFREVLTLSPGSVQASYGVARVFECLEEREAAIAAYEEVIAVDPTLEVAYIQLAVLLLEIERPAEAIAAYRRGLSALPDNVTLLNDLGTTLADEGELTEAVELLERALIPAPDDAMLLFNLGNFHDLTGRQTTAIDYYRRALRLEPHDLETTYNLALCLQDQEQYADALDQFIRVIEYGGERPEAAHLNAGLCFSNLGQLPMAEASYRRSVEIEPDYHLGWYNRGTSTSDCAVLKRRSPPSKKPHAAIQMTRSPGSALRSFWKNGDSQKRRRGRTCFQARPLPRRPASHRTSRLDA